jgi:hypothetical protein
MDMILYVVHMIASATQSIITFLFTKLFGRFFKNQTIEVLLKDPRRTLRLIRDVIWLRLSLSINCMGLNPFQREFGLKMIAYVRNADRYKRIVTHDKVNPG